MPRAAGHLAATTPGPPERRPPADSPRRSAPGGAASLVRDLSLGMLASVASGGGGLGSAGLGAPGLGRHFAVEAAEAEWLERAGDGAVVAYIDRADACARGGGRVVDTDRAWGTLHRCLALGGPGPLAYTVLGGRVLTGPAAPWLAVLAGPDRVAEAARALAPLDRGWLWRRYLALGAPDGGPCFPYLWERLVAVRRFHARAAGAGRAVLFTADR
ncbi:DUF1877 family protein [Streptomyces sp. NPDC001889]